MKHIWPNELIVPSYKIGPLQSNWTKSFFTVKLCPNRSFFKLFLIRTEQKERKVPICNSISIHLNTEHFVQLARFSPDLNLKHDHDVPLQYLSKHQGKSHLLHGTFCFYCNAEITFCFWLFFGTFPTYF